MRALDYDVAIIGAGTAGLAARKAAVEAGAKTVIIESGRGGTTCAAVGCMPSKLLIAAANSAQNIREAGLFGIDVDAPRIDGPKVLQRLRKERDYFVGSVLEDFDALSDRERLKGRARFIGPKRLLVADTEITAKAIVIATGSTPSIPEMLEPFRDRVLTNETLFELADLPRSLAVIGSGPLGLELGLAMVRLGVRVTLFDQSMKIAGLTDDSVERSAREVLGAELDFKLGVSLQAEAGQNGDVLLSWKPKAEGGAKAEEAHFDYVLAAAGRPPNLKGLDLDKADIELDEKGTPVFNPETMRCGESAVFIAGDADHQRPVLHTASHEGHIAGKNAAAFPNIERYKRHAAFSIVFTQPNIASVGPSLDQLDLDTLVIGHHDASDNGRVRVEGKVGGLICVYADRHSGKLIGGQMVAPQAEHLGHLLAWAVETGLTAEAVARLPVYHPTLEEAFNHALEELAKKVEG